MLPALAETVRAVFGARAVSILLMDGDSGELVFAAVSGEGSEALPGQRIPADAGIAGWVFSAGQPVAVEDVSQDPRFAGVFARSTGYLPRGIMAAPVFGDEAPIGVINVLDRPRRSEFSLTELELLERFSHLVALALASEESGAPDGAPLDDLAAALADLPPRRRVAAERLVDALAALLEA